MRHPACCCQSSWSSSNGAMADLRHLLFDGLLDTVDLDAHVVHRDAGDLGDLAVTQRFQKQGYDEAVLTRQRCDGAMQRGQPFPVLQTLVRADGVVRQVREFFGGSLL